MRSAEELSVLVGFDVLRMMRGNKPRSFTPMQIAGMVRAQAEVLQPLRIHPDVMACFAEYGGDLVDMQRRYDQEIPQPPAPSQEKSNG